MNSQSALRIGEPSEATGVSRDALRVDRIRFIKQAQAHGLTLQEVRDLASHHSDAERARCRHVRDLLARKLSTGR